MRIVFFKTRFVINFLINFFNFKVLKVKKFKNFRYKEEKILENKVRIKYLIPKFFNKRPKKITNKINYYFPKISFLTFNKAKVYGYSSFIVKDNFLLHHDLFNPNTNYCLEQFRGKCWFIKKNKIIWKQKKIDYKINEAISFLDSVSFNYAHWISEILPKIYLYRKYYKRKKVVILIDKNLHKNILQSLRIVVKGTNAIIKEVNKDECVLVNKLHTITPIGYSSHSPKNVLNKHNHGIFNQKIIDEMSNFISKKIHIKKNNLYKKILLSRDDSKRNVHNVDKFNTIITNLGYKKILLNDLDFEDQVKIFNNASDIIAVSGAAVANMIFSQKKTRLVLIANFREYGPGLFYYPTMLGNKKIDLHYIFSKEKLAFLNHKDLDLDFKTLKKFF